MNGYRGALVALIVLLASWGSEAGAAERVFDLGPPDPAYPVARQVRYRFTLENLSGAVVPEAEFWVYVPAGRTSTQQALRFTASRECERIVDGVGNQILHFEFRDIPPRGRKVVSIRAELALATDPVPVDPVEKASLLLPGRLVEADHPAIQRTAERLRGEGRTETAKQIFSWVAEYVRYAGYLEDDRGALYALRERSGDCTEYATLFAALARAGRVPVRVVEGFLVERDRVLRSADFHSWAEVYDDGRWLVADPQERTFGDGDGRYVATRIVTGSGDSPMGDRHRFRVEPASLRVTME